MLAHFHSLGLLLVMLPVLLVRILPDPILAIYVTLVHGRLRKQQRRQIVVFHVMLEPGRLLFRPSRLQCVSSAQQGHGLQLLRLPHCHYALLVMLGHGPQP